MNFRSKNIFAAILAVGLFSVSILAQDSTPTPAATPSTGPTAEQQRAAVTASRSGELTAEQVVESAIVIYGFPGGRNTLNQIRKTTFERGKSKIMNGDGSSQSATYQRWVLRGDDMDAEKVRLDQDFSTTRYAMLHNNSKIYGIFNNTVFMPREDAARSFENQVMRSLDALLRYKESGSTIEMAGKERQMGVDYNMIDLTDKAGRKTRFYVSARTFRVMLLEYDEGGVKYTRRFYDHRYAQGTLVPFRTVLLADDKVIEETEIGTITFGQKVDESLFVDG